MANTDLNGLEHSEISLNTATFAVALSQLLASFLVLHSEAPYSLINESPKIYQLIWICSALVVTFESTAIVMFLYARTIFLDRPDSGRWVQSFGLFSFICGFIAFFLSFTGLAWGYCDSSELLHFTDHSTKVIVFLILLFTMGFGPSFVFIHYLLITYVLKRPKRSSEYDALTQ